MFEFIPLTSENFPQMLEWLSKPHVKQWWDDDEDTLEKVALHYGAKDDVEKFILMEVKENAEKPIGYFQYYPAFDGAIGIDQFIVEEDYIDRGVGEKAIKSFIELIIAEKNPKEIVLDPSPENKRAIRCYEKVGFVHYETVKNEDGNLAFMMRYEIPTRYD